MYVINGSVPTECIGPCPWCGEKDSILHLTAATIEGKLCGEYVCADCLKALDAIRKEKRRTVLPNNPEVEIAKGEKE